MGISQETISEVRTRVKLIDVVQEVVQLKRSGSNLMGLCPFHTEKTPSFHVKEDYFHCFGCGQHGDAIGFTMKNKGLSFPDSVEFLAQKFGIAVRYDGGRKDREKPAVNLRAIFRVNELALEFFRNRYLGNDGSAARAYITGRSISEEAQKAFCIGFAPDRWSELTEYLRSRSVPDDIVLLAGLAKRTERGELIDAFRGRVIFPIFMDEKRVAGFGGRILPVPGQEERGPKYLNTRETPVYEKSRIFYGMPQSLPAIRKAGELFLVEGYMDVIGVWQAGLKNVLATCGTAVTPKHIQRLKHAAKRVVFLFDGDSAGRVGAGKSFPIFVNSGLDASAIFLPEGEDPDTFVLKNAADPAGALDRLGRVSLFECFVDWRMREYGAGNAKSLGAAAKGKICFEVAEVLRKIENSVEKNDLVQKAAMMLMTDSVAIEHLINGVIVDFEKKEISLHETPSNKICTVEELEAAERDIITALMGLRSEISVIILNDSELSGYLKPATMAFVERMHEVFTSSSLLDQARKERTKALLVEYGPSWLKLWEKAFKMAADKDVDLKRLFEDCRMYFRKKRQKEEIDKKNKELLDQLKQLAPSGQTG